MSNYELMQLIIKCKDEKEIKKLLEENRVDVKDSKYC